MRRRTANPGWLLLPRSYVYIGIVLSFTFGVFFGKGFFSGPSSSVLTENGNTNTLLRGKALRKNVLVTGGLGFIGSHVVEDLIENGYNVIILDDMSNGHNFNKQSAAILLKDITQLKDYEYITQRIEYVVHLAAAISVTESVRMPEKYETINVEGSRLVFEWAKQHGVKKVVAASSAACYGVPTPENIPLQEDSANGGIAPYSQTKFKMEKLMEQYADAYSLPTVALRFFNVYGPRQDPKSDYSGVISWFMDQAKDNGKIKVTGDGTQYRDFVYVKDVARAIRISMESKTSHFFVTNVCTGLKTSINTLALEIKNVFTSSASIIHVDPRPGDVMESVCDPTRAKNLLDFTATTTLSQGLQSTKQWFMKNE